MLKGQFLFLSFLPDIRQPGILLSTYGFTHDHRIAVHAEPVDEDSLACVPRQILESVMISGQIAIKNSSYLDTDDIEYFKLNVCCCIEINSK